MTNWQHRGVKVPPRRKHEIQALARRLRHLSGTGVTQPIDLVRLLEIKLGQLGVQTQVIEQALMGDCEALTDPDGLTIKIREDVYDALFMADGRARFTVAHEIGHLMLHENMALARDARPLKAYEDSEWQADVYAAELLVPLEIASQYSCPYELASTMQVSVSCARYRIEEGKMKKASP